MIAYTQHSDSTDINELIEAIENALKNENICEFVLTREEAEVILRELHVRKVV